ncbi:hypothetical protein B0O95_11387 [Mycetohabitans endofungorum]|uniref:Uncharacterized protein n=1 Tax=Mycetohabitans endofungorum TaxID=417203 RepID=A0A2P5K7Y2_9BURK|nr:hypothetical protein B0O95_11387 [Mycetohabitans endofungorum]
MSAAGGDQPDAFCAVVRRAAPQRDDEVTTFSLEQVDTVVDIDVGRIGFGTRKDHGLKPSLTEVACDDLGDPHLVQAGIRYDKRLFRAERLGSSTGFACTTRSDEGHAGNEKAVGTISDV